MTQEDRLSILEQLIDDGEVDPIEAIRTLTEINTDLLEAFKELINFVEHPENFSKQAMDNVVEFSTKAIAKAEGK